jgi:Fur family ferric uptake transcriptional regulator
MMPVTMPPTDDVAARLRAAGLRATRPRIAVYEALRRAGGHRSVDEIASLLSRRAPAVSRMSVYNVVADLTAAGLLMCADTGPGRALYEVADRWHHHFVCRVCGAVADVPCVRGEKPCLEPPASLAASVEEAQVIFRGVCRACARRPRHVTPGKRRVAP